MQVYTIFPTVIASSQYEEFSLIEKETLLRGVEYQPDAGFISTVDTYVLDKVPELKAWIQKQLDAYASEVMGIEGKLRITQSWCLVHAGRPQVVYPHRHSNSIISGSFYVVAPSGTQGITFHKNSGEKTVDHPLIDWKNREDQPWLKTTETFDVVEGKLILFQSHMLHSVKSDYIAPRCVLAFNTWFDGPIGNERTLNYLGVAPVGGL